MAPRVFFFTGLFARRRRHADTCSNAAGWQWAHRSREVGWWARGAKAEGYWHGRWQQQQAGAPHATPALINISPRPTSPIALAQYLIFKITDDKKFIEIEHKVRVRVRVRVREPTLP